MDKITFCIPSKDNLRYLKTCIPSIRKNAFRKDHDIIIFIDQDNDGTLDWCKDNQDKYNFKYIINPDLNKSRFGIGKAYDECIKQAETKIVLVFHADMMLGKNADKLAYDRLSSNTVVCCTRVEPPLHPNNGEKIIRDFGMWPEEFKEKAFDKFVDENASEDKITNGIFAPWMVFKDEFLELGGHDPILKSCREDSDVFNRMLLKGFNFVQPWNSLVYHLTGRGAGSFSGDEKRHTEWKKEMENSTLEFIRKWGTQPLHNNLMLPIVMPFYNISIILKNVKELGHIKLLEPWCSKLYSDNLSQEYIDEFNDTTSYNLNDRVFKSNLRVVNDIEIFINMDDFDQINYNYIQQISQIMHNQKPQTGNFSLGSLDIAVNSITEYEYRGIDRLFIKEKV